MNGIRVIITCCIITSISLVLFSCKDNSTAPSGSRHVAIAGRVSLIANDETGIWVDHSGIVVSLESTAYAATTDSFGNWHLSNVPAGTYNVSVSRSNYITTRFIGFDFTRDSTFFFSSIGTLPSFNVTDVSESVNGDTMIFVGSLSNTSPYTRKVMVYLGFDTTVSNENSRSGVGREDIAPWSSTFRVWVSTSTVKANGFPTDGMKVYVAAYGYVRGSGVYSFPTNSGYTLSVSPIPARSTFIMP